MKLRRLLDSFHFGDFREKINQQTRLIQELEPAPRRALGKNLGQFVAETFLRDLADLWRQVLNGSKRGWFDRVPETRGESNCTNYAEFVFTETCLWVADGANDSGLQILASTHEIEDFIRFGIEQQRIDGEIPALDVILRRAGVVDPIRMAAIRVPNVRTESRHFDLQTIGIGCAGRFLRDDHDPEFGPNGETAREDFFHLSRK